MSDRLRDEYERRKHASIDKKNRKSDFTRKDRVTLIVSLLALIVSATTAYITTFRQVDDLRLVIDFVPIPMKSNIDDGSRFQGNLKFTIMNAGNQASSIAAVSLVTMDVAGSMDQFRVAGRIIDGMQLYNVVENIKRTECNEGTHSYTYLSLKPFVLKPGEIVFTDYVLEDSEKIVSREKKTFAVCLQFRIITPGDGVKYVVFDILRSDGMSSVGTRMGGATETLYRHRSSALWSLWN